MFRLTLRSARDGRFLARVVDQGSGPFVLDFGDDRIIDDLSQHLQHGFTLWRFGQLVITSPDDANFMALLAEFYAKEGLLVFLEDPESLDEGEGSAEQVGDDEFTEDRPTEIVSGQDFETEIIDED